MKFDKYYYENYAKLNLYRTVDDSLCALEKSEEPDWILHDYTLGVEVTRAIPAKWAETDSIVNDYFGKGLDGEFIIKEIERMCKKGFNAELSSIDGHAIYSQEKGCFDFNIYLEEIRKSIISKEKKLTHYTKCKKMWLYIFAHSSMLNDVDIEKVISGVEYTFEKLFINAEDNLFVIDNHKLISVVKISEEELKYLKCTSREMQC